MHDFAARIHAVIDTLDDTQKQQLLRLLIEDVRVTGWHVQIRLRIALDPPPPDPTGPTEAHRHHTRAQCQAKTVCVPLVTLKGDSYRLKDRDLGRVPDRPPKNEHLVLQPVRPVIRR